MVLFLLPRRKHPPKQFTMLSPASSTMHRAAGLPDENFGITCAAKALCALVYQARVSSAFCLAAVSYECVTNTKVGARPLKLALSHRSTTHVCSAACTRTQKRNDSEVLRFTCRLRAHFKGALLLCKCHWRDRADPSTPVSTTPFLESCILYY